MIPPIHCLNCKQSFPSGRGKTVLGVLVCVSCASMAERIVGRAEQELQQLLTLMKEQIRVSIIEGRMQFAPGAEPPSKEEVLKSILELSQRKA